MSIYDPPETFHGKLPSKYQNGDKIIYKEQKGTISAVEFHDDGKVQYLIRNDDPEHGGLWCESNAFTKA